VVAILILQKKEDGNIVQKNVSIKNITGIV
jgi:hypothetical protein